LWIAHTAVRSAENEADNTTETIASKLASLEATSSLFAKKTQRFTQSNSKDQAAFSSVNNQAKVNTTVAPVKSSTENPLIGHSTSEGITTDLGGVFYLLNLMQRLDMPDCFEPDWPLQQLSPWALLELLARGLLLQSGSDNPEDPLWQLLSQLDGREPETPIGEGFFAADHYRIPLPWLQMIANGPMDIAYAQTAGVFRIWSTAEYLIAEQASGAGQTTREQVLSVMNCYDSIALNSLKRKAFYKSPVFDTHALLKQVASPDLLRWLNYVLPFISYLLALLTRNDTGQFDSNLLRCRGRVFVTNAHIDFCTKLDNIALPIRCAGLDVNPGWLPECGKVVLFQFE
jgi:hypothetical protein